MIGQLIQAQATILAYIDVFHVCAIVAALMIPLVLILVRRVQTHGQRWRDTELMHSMDPAGGNFAAATVLVHRCEPRWSIAHRGAGE